MTARLFDGSKLRADLFEQGGTRLLVTFDHRTKGKTGFADKSPSQNFANAGFDQLHIHSAANDWFINDQTSALESTLRHLPARYAAVHAIGFSMGGYGALRFASTLALRHVVCVSPQISIAPSVVPWDSRYHAEAATFDPDLGAMVGLSREALSGVILADGLLPRDIRHARLIMERFPGLRLIRLPGGGHPASRVLREAGKAWMIQRMAMDPQFDAAPLYVAHRAQRRHSPLYWAALARRAEARHPSHAAYARRRAAALAPEGR